MDLKTLKQQIDAETARIWKQEPLELKKIRLGIIDNQAGSYGQYFATWDFANSMIRDYSQYTLHPLLKLSQEADFSLDHCRRMFCAFDPQYTVYLGYSGYHTLNRFCREFEALLPQLESKEIFIDMLISLMKYANKLCQWSFHYFPHNLGGLFPQARACEIAEVLEMQGVDGSEA